MECKLLHCEYKASRGVDYQSMPLQCIVFSGLICSQHAIEMDLVSQKAPKIMIPMIQVPYPYH